MVREIRPQIGCSVNCGRTNNIQRNLARMRWTAAMPQQALNTIAQGFGNPATATCSNITAIDFADWATSHCSSNIWGILR